MNRTNFTIPVRRGQNRNEAMNDFRTMYGNKSPYLKASDLAGDFTVTIRAITSEVIGTGKDADEKPVFYFDECEKGLFTNKTNGDAIGMMYGFDPAGLIGKRITIFPTVCQNSKGATVPCIRVNPRRPDAPRNGNTNGNGQQRPVFGRAAQLPQASPPADEFNYSDDDAFATKLATSFETRGFDEESILECVQEQCRRREVADVYGLSIQDRKSLMVSVQTGRFDSYKAAQRQRVA